jgi:hypothetical protein
MFRREAVQAILLERPDWLHLKGIDEPLATYGDRILGLSAVANLAIGHEPDTDGGDRVSGQINGRIVHVVTFLTSPNGAAGASRELREIARAEDDVCQLFPAKHMSFHTIVRNGKPLPGDRELFLAVTPPGTVPLWFKTDR